MQEARAALCDCRGKPLFDWHSAVITAAAFITRAAHLWPLQKVQYLNTLGKKWRTNQTFEWVMLGFFFFSTGFFANDPLPVPPTNLKDCDLQKTAAWPCFVLQPVPRDTNMNQVAMRSHTTPG